eukprot:CAMPEP_0117892372 /NCGR_PEP_ID=MMETSP0950-20121206/24628_1 /TAXON_ID=44440 /ORGANISM="Chattonella subsalsa, Strain CCMP2191" /LENGTH=223 /DNA_ID=CAMNT_0005752301 /DNA_START=88 /DNA_END=756 /DNA_ORIENTATION=+
MWIAVQLLFYMSIFCYAVSAFIAKSSLPSTSNNHFSSIEAESSPTTVRQRTRSKTKHGSNAEGSSPTSTKHHDDFSHISHPALFTSVDDFRHYYGSRSNWWGDYSSGETRNFYHTLLPVSLTELEGFSKLSLEDQAKVASMSRHAARLYARERCTLPGRLVAQIYDGYRTLKSLGRWSPNGLTWEDLWAKYEREIMMEYGGDISSSELTEKICLRILQKSCAT